MRHRKHTFKQGANSSYRKALLMNLVGALFIHERIKTTLPKAKEARRLAERMITLAKKNTLHTRRLALKKLRNKAVVSKLFSEYGPRYTERNGGYTRIIRLHQRQSDDASMVYLELVDRLGVEAETAKPKEKKAAKPAQKAAKAEVAAETVEETVAVEAEETVAVEEAEVEAAAEEAPAEAEEEKKDTE